MMYSLVLMMALGNGASVPADTVARNDSTPYANHGHVADRGRGCNCNCSCNGGRGGRGGRRCHGCYGCYGGGYGCWGGGCHGGWGYGCHGGGGCHGGCHGYGSYGYGSYGYGSFDYGSFLPGMIGANTATEAPATIIVNLPANAKLLVDDQPTMSQSERRTFVSPPIPAGQKFEYTLKAEIERDGKPVTETKQVSVEAGRQTQVTFDFNTRNVAQR